MIFLNIFVGERGLDLSPQVAAAGLNRQVEDIFPVLKFVFSTQRNSFEITDFLISNILFCAYKSVRYLKYCAGIIKDDAEI